MSAAKESKATVIMDSILHYWLSGALSNEELSAWWETTDAADCAQEMACAVLEGLKDKGFSVKRRK